MKPVSNGYLALRICKHPQQPLWISDGPLSTSALDNAVDRLSKPLHRRPKELDDLYSSLQLAYPTQESANRYVDVPVRVGFDVNRCRYFSRFPMQVLEPSP